MIILLFLWSYNWFVTQISVPGTKLMNCNIFLENTTTNAKVQSFGGMYFDSTTKFTIDYTKYKFIDMLLLYRNIRRRWKPILYETDSTLHW
jgi:hypothetical protein